MGKLTNDELRNVAALLRDEIYMQQCDGLYSVLKTSAQAASAIDELLSYRQSIRGMAKYVGQVSGNHTFITPGDGIEVL